MKALVSSRPFRAVDTLRARVIAHLAGGRGVSAVQPVTPAFPDAPGLPAYWILHAR